MKKSNISFLILLPLVLTSCNSNPVGLPNKGTEISAEEGKAKFKQSYDAVVSNESNSNDFNSFEISLSNVSFNIDADVSTKDSDGKEKSPYAKFGFHVNDLKVSYAMKGLKSTNSEDVKGCLSVEFTLDYSFEYDLTITDLVSNTVSSKLDKKTYAFDIYLDSEGIYFDFSNENVLKFIKNFTVLDPTLATFNGKCYVESPFSTDALPILKTSEIDVETYTKIESSLINVESEGTFKSHGNDTYSYSYSIDGTKLNDELNKVKENVNSDFTGDLNLNLYASLLDFITFDSSSKLEYAVVFNTEKGISSIGYNENLKANYNNTKSNMTGSVTSSSSAKLSVDFGSDVKVKELTDKSGYQKF